MKRPDPQRKLTVVNQIVRGETARRAGPISDRVGEAKALVLGQSRLCLRTPRLTGLLPQVMLANGPAQYPRCGATAGVLEERPLIPESGRVGRADVTAMESDVMVAIGDLGDQPLRPCVAQSIA